MKKYLNTLWTWIDSDDAPDRKFYAFCIITLTLCALVIYVDLCL